MFRLPEIEHRIACAEVQIGILMEAHAFRNGLFSTVLDFLLGYRCMRNRCCLVMAKDAPLVDRGQIFYGHDAVQFYNAVTHRYPFHRSGCRTIQ
ncbi:hypothetical protein HMPREF2830_13865 [Pseudomonas aeruginosa]|nr:hypothetical protein JF43_25610 [Pseudomonas aeruginosa]OFK19815.1 hypothetical protein HMPREF2830_13865 [Pseudomonas aeruginosa]